MKNESRSTIRNKHDDSSVNAVVEIEEVNDSLWLRRSSLEAVGKFQFISRIYTRICGKGKVVSTTP
jgi:hypothetical protein